MNKKSAEVASMLVGGLDKLVADMKPEDLLIMSMGAFAGSRGYTPLTALFSVGGLSVGSVSDLKAKADKGDVVAGFQVGFGGSPLGMFTGAIPLVGLISGLNSAAQVASKGSGPDVTPEMSSSDKNIVVEAIYSKIALACIGAIEAYTITRPGTLAGVGEIVKGIGEIVPG